MGEINIWYFFWWDYYKGVIKFHKEIVQEIKWQANLSDTVNADILNKILGNPIL